MFQSADGSARATTWVRTSPEKPSAIAADPLGQKPSAFNPLFIASPHRPVPNSARNEYAINGNRNCWLNVNRPLRHRHRRLLNRFRHRRMRMAGAGEVFRRAGKLHQDRDLVDHLARAEPHDM